LFLAFCLSIQPIEILQAVVHLNVIVPCYNPPEGWERALAGRFLEFKKMVADLTASVGLIVVNDGSSINTDDENFRRLKTALPGVQIVHYRENRGKGYALRQGVAASNSDFHIVTDFDFPYTLASMRRIATFLIERGGIAAGNRDTAYYDKVPFFRRLLSKALRWVLRNVLRQPVDDSQCGLKGFDNRGKAVFLQTSIDRFLFDLEFLMLAAGTVPVTPVPVELREGVLFSRVGLKILAAEGRNFLRLVLRKPRSPLPKSPIPQAPNPQSPL
jgi:glycosyltransferase involved in cell wall biosynthesis